MTNTFKVGDILHHQFHYTASFPQFFKVVKTSPKCVWVVRLHNRIVENLDGYGQHGMEVPEEMDVTDDIMARAKRCSLRLRYDGVPSVLVDSYLHEYATLWDGKPKEFYGD